jgi:hypothetical protein
MNPRVHHNQKESDRTQIDIPVSDNGRPRKWDDVKHQGYVDQKEQPAKQIDLVDVIPVFNQQPHK